MCFLIFPLRSLNQREEEGKFNYSFNLLTNNIAKYINTIDVHTIKSGLTYAKLKIDQDQSIKNKSWLLNLIENHLQANYIYDERLTDKVEEDPNKKRN